MSHDKLLDKIEAIEYWQEHYANKTFLKALKAVVKLHTPSDEDCKTCPTWNYPCPTIQAIEKELS